MRLRYAWRIWPATTEVVPLLLGAAWAVGSRLDTPFERSVLIVACTVGLSSAFADPWAAMTDASPTTLRIRRALPGGIATSIALAGWVVVRCGTAAVLTTVGRPGWAEVAELVVIATTQLAVGLVVARRRGSVGIGPGAALALGWSMLAGLPDLHGRVYTLSNHRALWTAALVVAVLVATLATTDPAR